MLSRNTVFFVTLAVLLTASLSGTHLANAEVKSVPGWLKDLAGLWANDEITAGEFSKAIEYLISEGIIAVDGSDSISCGQGTELKDGVCEVANSITCGEGTELKGNVCQVKNDPSPLGELSWFRPIPYASEEDSPFKRMEEKMNEIPLHIETFESGSWQAPGASPSTGEVRPPHRYTGSVDYEEDNNNSSLNSSGNDGHSFQAYPSNKLTIYFDSHQLGAFPTYAGFTITGLCSPSCTASFEVFDSEGNHVDEIEFEIETTDPRITSDDRFVGAYYSSGIGSIKISSPSANNIQIDHLQYGR